VNSVSPPLRKGTVRPSVFSLSSVPPPDKRRLSLSRETENGLFFPEWKNSESYPPLTLHEKAPSSSALSDIARQKSVLSSPLFLLRYYK